MPTSRRPPKDRPLLEAALQNLEAGIDLAIDNEAVRSIPVIGTAFKICKGLDDLRTRALVAKLASFVQEPSLRSSSALAKIKRKLTEDPEELQRIGEVLFLTLEKLSSMDKPALLGQVFSAYLDEVIDGHDLRRIALAIEVAFSEDLLQLLQAPEDLHHSDGSDWKLGLLATGFIRPFSGETWDDVGKVWFRLTPLAASFRKAVAHATRMASSGAA